MEVSQLTDQRPACHVLEMNWDPMGTRVLWGVWGAPSPGIPGYVGTCLHQYPASLCFPGLSSVLSGTFIPTHRGGSQPEPNVHTHWF